MKSNIYLFQNIKLMHVHKMQNKKEKNKTMHYACYHSDVLAVLQY